jgi:hypothetical protein
MVDLPSYLLRSAVFLALFYALYWLTLRRETLFALNRAFLLGAAVLSLTLPLLRVPSPFFETVVYASPLRAPVDVPIAGVPARGPGVQELLFAIYIAGAGALLLLFLARVARLAFLVARCGCVRHLRLPRRVLLVLPFRLPQPVQGPARGPGPGPGP